MILSYKECIKIYRNDYQLAKAIAEGKVYRMESGMYSTDEYAEELAIIVKKYPHAILTGEYAFYYHELTDVIPEKYFIATKKNSVKFKDPRIVQVYVKEELLQLGVQEKKSTEWWLGFMIKNVCLLNCCVIKTIYHMTYIRKS